MERAAKQRWWLTALACAVLLAGACERRRVPRAQERDAATPPAARRDAGADVADAGTAPTTRCTAARIVRPIRFETVTALDVLFVFDDSPTMELAQQELSFLFPQLLTALSSDATGTRSVHLAVASGDLGLSGVDGVESCTRLGEDAMLQRDPPPELDCGRSLPAFLSFTVGSLDPPAPSDDFSCMTTLGTSGCGLQQPLEVALKALWPSRDTRVQFAGDQVGRGDTSNAGFLRDEAHERSVLALVLVTNKDDCSLIDPAAFAAGAGLDAHTGTELVARLNAHCAQAPGHLHELSRYIEAFEQLRPGHERLFVFAAIAGMPRFAHTFLAAADADDQAALDGFYDQLLGSPAMQIRIDDRGTPEPNDDTLDSACDGHQGPAWPARRLVEFARSLGSRGVVGSFCHDDWGDTVRALVERARRMLGDPCLDVPLERDDRGLVDCELIWTLPPSTPPAGGADPCERADLPFLRPGGTTPERSADGGFRCRLPQLRVVKSAGELAPIATEHDGQVFEQGWFYDDFSAATRLQCAREPRRVALTPGLPPAPADVRVSLDCAGAALGVDANKGCRLDTPSMAPKDTP